MPGIPTRCMPLGVSSRFGGCGTQPQHGHRCSICCRGADYAPLCVLVYRHGALHLQAQIDDQEPTCLCAPKSTGVYVESEGRKYPAYGTTATGCSLNEAEYVNVQAVFALSTCPAQAGVVTFNCWKS